MLASHYEGAALVGLGAAQAGDPQTASLLLDAAEIVGRNDMELFVFANDDNSQFWLTARLDNLGKGASGAAVQNMNLALGLEPTTGLVA